MDNQNQSIVKKIKEGKIIGKRGLGFK